MSERLEKYLVFLNESIEYFQKKFEGVDRDRYFADRDIRSILDKTINDIILTVTDISKEFLKTRRRFVPDTYRDRVLACHEFLGDVVLKVAPLTKNHNEMIHQYLKINWQNVVIVKNKIGDIERFADEVRNKLLKASQIMEERFKKVMEAIKSCDANLVSLQLNCIKRNEDLGAFMKAKGPILLEIAQDTLLKTDDAKCKMIIEHLYAAQTGKEIGADITAGVCNENKGSVLPEPQG